MFPFNPYVIKLIPDPIVVPISLQMSSDLNFKPKRAKANLPHTPARKKKHLRTKRPVAARRTLQKQAAHKSKNIKALPTLPTNNNQPWRGVLLATILLRKPNGFQDVFRFVRVPNKKDTIRQLRHKRDAMNAYFDNLATSAAQWREQVVRELEEEQDSRKKERNLARFKNITDMLIHAYQESAVVIENEKDLADLYRASKYHRNMPPQEYVAPANFDARDAFFAECEKIVEEQDKERAWQDKIANAPNLDEKILEARRQFEYEAEFMEWQLWHGKHWVR